MRQEGYKEESLGRTSCRDREILIRQLNEDQDAHMVHEVLHMPSESSE